MIEEEEKYEHYNSGEDLRVMLRTPESDNAKSAKDFYIDNSSKKTKYFKQ